MSAHYREILDFLLVKCKKLQFFGLFMQLFHNFLQLYVLKRLMKLASLT